ncbi:hypothetical protein QOZ80_3BG0288580 [Eleusine coracana subsp. coracana]|nr:hypothetical protein QOZ80_3BG0288580 [Eleusine coracana subsp. coracana]
MAGGHANNEQVPQWLHVLLRTMFWEPCSKGHTKENRAEDCIFCLQCYQVFCPHCTHDVRSHRLLKVRRYVYRSVVLVKDMQELNIDVSRIQPYIINGQTGVHLRPMRRSSLFRPSADVSQDDFSGPEAERRYRNSQPHMVQPAEADGQRLPAEPDHGAEAEAEPPAPEPAGLLEENRLSYRTRPRKQEKPRRSPFF